MIRDGLNGAIYVNGVLSTYAVANSFIAYQNMNLVFGVDYRDYSNFFKGTMDNVALYSQALTGAQVNALYKSAVQYISTSPANPPTTQQQPSCDYPCIIAIVCSLLGVVLAIGAIVSTYHVYYLQRRRDRQ